MNLLIPVLIFLTSLWNTSRVSQFSVNHLLLVLKEFSLDCPDCVCACVCVHLGVSMCACGFMFMHLQAQDWHPCPLWLLSSITRHLYSFEAVSLSESAAPEVLLPGQWAPGILSLLHSCARVKGVQLWQDFYMDSGHPNSGACVCVGLHFTNGAIFLARHLRCHSVLYVSRDGNNCEQPVFVCFWLLQLMNHLWKLLSGKFYN